MTRTGYAGRIVVFAANLGSRERAQYAQTGATVIDHGIHLHRVLRRPLQALLWSAVRRWPDAGALSPPWDRLQQPNVLRWSLYRQYLSEHCEEFDRVLMVDLRDVCFQRDPFEGIDPNYLRVHTEEGDITVQRSEWNAMAMRRAFGEEVAKRYGGLRVSCSGVVAGGTGPVRSYLDAFVSMLSDLRMPDHGNDQAIHTRIVHTDLASLVQWQSNREGNVVHLAGIHDPSSIPRDDAERLLNSSRVPFAILHQFDRHPSLDLCLRSAAQKQRD